VPARRVLPTLNASSPLPGVKSNARRVQPALALAKEQITVKLLPSAPCTARLAVIATLGVLLAPAVARATGPTFVQGAAFATGSRVLTSTVTLTRPVASGDLLVGWFAQYDVQGQVQVADNVNGAW